MLVGGANLSGDIGSLGRIGGGPGTLDVTGIDKSAYERIGGVRTGAIEFSSWFNPSAGQAHQTLKTLPYTDTLVTYLRGVGIGAPAASCVAKQVGYDPTRAADGALSIGVATMSNSFGLEWGQQLTAGPRTDTTATNGASLDGLAASAFGAQFYLHVLAFTGTSVTVTVQDSADNATWANLTGAAFTAATGVGWERIATANNATVRRYLRVITTGTFTNAVFAVNGVRNPIAGQMF